MKKLLYFNFLWMLCLSAYSQPMPIMRNAMTTNVAGTPVLSRNDLSVTNVSSGTNWLFYGVVSQTVARLSDVWGNTGAVSLVTVSNTITGYGSNVFILITNGVGTNTTFYPSNDATLALRANGPIVVSNDMRGPWAGGYITGTNAGFYVDGGDGDINGSGTIQLADLAAIQNWITLAPASDTYLTNPAAKARADVDGNGLIDFSDYALATYAQSGGDVLDLRRRFQRSKGGVYGVDTNEFFIIGTRELVIPPRLFGRAKLELINTNTSVPDFMINTNQLLFTNGVLKIGGAGNGNAVDPMVMIVREISSGAGNAHAFSDSTTISARPGIGYNSIDTRPIYTGANNYDHYASFQFDPIWGSSGTNKNIYGIYAQPELTNGVVSNYYAVMVVDPVKTIPADLSNYYGIFIDSMTAGTITNIAIRTVGSAPVVFGGSVWASSGVGHFRSMMVGTNQDPTKQLDVQTGNGVESAIRIRQIGQNWWDIANPASDTRLDISDVSAATYGPYITILNKGNVGLSTNNPQARLHVKGSVIIETNLAVKGSNYVAGQSYFGNTVYVDGAGSGLEVDGLTVTNGITNFGTFFIRDNAASNALWRCTNTTTGQGTWANNYLNSTEVSNLVSSVAYGQTWFVWGSSNTLATNAAGTPYKAMLKGDTPLPTTANTNTYTTPTAGQYVGEIITAIPAGISLIVPGDIVTESFAYLSENRTMVLQPEIYIRTNMIAPSFSALGEREVAVGPSFTVNNTFQSFAVSIPVTTNIVLSTTNYLVRKLRVVSVSGGTPNLFLVSQDSYPARVTFPIASSSFVLKSGDTMLGTLVLTNSYNVGSAFRSIGTGLESEQFGLGATASGVRGIAMGRDANAGTDLSIAIGYTASANTLSGTGSVAIGESPFADADNSVAIGFHAQVSAPLGVAIGSSSTADGGDTEIAIGPGSHAAFHNSTAIGYGVHSTKPDQMIFGQNTNMITFPGFFELPLGAAVGSIWQCTNATTGRGQWNATQYKSVWIDAGAMATNAAGGPTVGYYTATNYDGIYSDVWDYDSTTPQTNYFKLMMPDSWDLGTVKVKFYYFTTAVAASTSNVWAVCAQAINPGDLFGFRGTEVQVTNLVQDTTNKLNMCVSPAITVGGTPALGNIVHFQIRRVADSGWDNSAGNARLLGVAIQWNDKRSNPTIW